MREEIKEKGIIRESRWKSGNETQFTIFFLWGVKFCARSSSSSAQGHAQVFNVGVVTHLISLA